jgi:C4-dicarboxylate-specific signal transduction histidine kinase
VTAGGEAVRALADRQQTEQILWNLIANAAQAGAARVTLRVVAAGGRARIDVEDDGPGVEPELRDHDRIFRPFVTTKQRGAGLGLAASRRMARDNGGDLRLEPSDEGAHFALELEPS